MSDQQAKKVYFASDFHLGVPTYEKSLEREKKIVAWLNHIEPTALEIFLVGDIFDFRFEYKHAIPKGFVRLQGKIAELTDKEKEAQAKHPNRWKFSKVLRLIAKYYKNKLATEKLALRTEKALSKLEA